MFIRVVYQGGDCPSFGVVLYTTIPPAESKTNKMLSIVTVIMQHFLCVCTNLLIRVKCCDLRLHRVKRHTNSLN